MAKHLEQDALPNWTSLAELAGPPPQRVFASAERLFGAQAPLVQFWHDSAGWCPFCMQLWMAIEEMRLPYASRAIPLNTYLKPGEKKPAEYLRLRPDGTVPAIQLANKNCKEVTFGPALESGRKPGFGPSVEILKELLELFPDYALLPRTPRRRAFAEALFEHVVKLERVVLSRASVDQYVSVMDDFEEAFGGRPREKPGRFATTRWNDDADGDDLKFGSPLGVGPFLFGKRPCHIDMMMLPMLERASLFAHPMANNNAQLALSRWPALDRMFESAKLPGICAYADLGADPESLIAYKHRGMQRAPDVAEVSAEIEPAVVADAASRQEAAALICANFDAIARFACGAKGSGRSIERRFDKSVAPAVVTCTEDALRACADLLLQGPNGGHKALHEAVAVRCAMLKKTHGSSVASEVSWALHFLANNICVPRDMTAPVALALRLYLSWLSSSMISTAKTKQNRSYYS